MHEILPRLKKLKIVFGLLFSIAGHVAFSQQPITVSGKVNDDLGLPLPGVNIIVEGTATGTASDADGAFTLQVPNSDATLVFSFIGYTTQRVKVGTQTNFDIKLMPDLMTLEEVVVVGYGTERKRDVAGAISSIGAQTIDERKPLNVFDALQGQAAGVHITAESGRPGAGSTVRIRGIGTMQGGANPLYVIDGALADSPDGVNPNDIEKIEVLKDGASTAMYGVQGANGVIIITTKKGVTDKPKFDINFLQTYRKMAHKVPQASARQRREFERLTSSTGVTNPPVDSLNPSINADNDMLDMLTRTAVRQQLDVSMSGGSKQMSYYASLGYLGEEGIIINSFNKTLRNRINLDFGSGRLTGGSRLMFSYSNENRIDESRTLRQAIQRPPTFRVYFPDGTLATVLGGRRNPVAEALKVRNRYDTYDASVYNFLSFKITEYLKFTSDFQIRLGNIKRNRLDPLLVTTNGTNSLLESMDQRTYWINQNYLNFEKTFGSDHKVTAVLGISADKRSSWKSNIEGTNLVSETVPTTNTIQLVNLLNTKTEQSASTNASLFGRVGYNYQGRYIFNANVRRDGSSKFGKDKLWGVFPGVSAAWRFTDESFMAWSSAALDDGKLRVSYGETGNNRIPDYAAIQQYNFGSNYYNGISGAVLSNSFGNSTLGWETNKQFNIGTDLALLRGRATLVFDYYNKTNESLLYQSNLPPETGFRTMQVNIGSIQNEGVELAINGYPIDKGALRWNTGFNITFNKGTVKELAGGEAFVRDNRWYIEEGGRLGDFFGFKYLGVYPYSESNAYSDSWVRLTLLTNADGTMALDETGQPQYTLNGQPYTGTVNKMRSGTYEYVGGDVIWKDNNGDGQIDDTDRQILGNAQPKYYLGWNNVLTYKNFSLSFNFYMSWGSKIYDKARRDTYVMSPTNVTPQPYFIENAWQNPGDVTDVWRARNVPQNLREVSSYFIEDGSFVRLRNIRLGYTLGKAITSKLHLRSLSAYVYGSNLATWTNYLFFDPEINISDPLEMGMDLDAYPRKREFGAGLNISF